MKEKRYFYSENLNVGELVTLDGEEFHHLSNVMRTRQGENVCLFNGDGNFYFGTVKTIAKKFAEIEVFDKVLSENEPNVDFTLFQALAKGEKLSLITQKITELGATNLNLFESTFCDVKGSYKFDRLEQISISAAKQCGRATILNINGGFNIAKIAEKIKDYDAFYVAYEAQKDDNLVLELSKLKNNNPKIAVLIGPEGGLSETEIEKLKTAGAKIVTLGKRILRTETAAIACTTLVMQLIEK